MAIGETGNTLNKRNLSLIDANEAAANNGVKKATDQEVRKQAPAAVRDALLDRVDLGLAKYINDELSPAAMDSERAKRVAELKAQYQAGTLEQPSSEDLAAALVRELALEIGTAGVRTGNGDE